MKSKDQRIYCNKVENISYEVLKTLTNYQYDKFDYPLKRKMCEIEGLL